MKYDIKIKVLECEFNGTVEAENEKEASIKTAEKVIKSIEILRVEPRSKDIKIDYTHNFLKDG